VQTWVTRVGTSSYDLSCRIVDPGEEGAETVYSTAEVRLVAYDTATGRSRPLTAEERQRLELSLGPA
jgi:acyl-CoA thioesterase FadM